MNIIFYSLSILFEQDIRFKYIYLRSYIDCMLNSTVFLDIINNGVSAIQTVGGEADFATAQTGELSITNIEPFNIVFILSSKIFGCLISHAST